MFLTQFYFVLKFGGNLQELCSVLFCFGTDTWHCGDTFHGAKSLRPHAENLDEI